MSLIPEPTQPNSVHFVSVVPDVFDFIDQFSVNMEDLRCMRFFDEMYFRGGICEM